jgi:hypothetical protein
MEKTGIVSILCILIITAVAVMTISSMNNGVSILTGKSTAVPVSGTVTTGGSIDCSVSPASIDFGSAAAGTSNIKKPAAGMTITSLATNVGLDATWQMTASGSWIYTAENAGFQTLNGVTAGVAAAENTGYTGGTKITNTLGLAMAPSAATEKLYLNLNIPSNTFAKAYSGTLTVTCAANANGLNTAAATFHQNIPGMVPATTLSKTNPNPYAVLLSDVLTGGVPTTAAVNLYFIDSASGAFVPVTLQLGNCQAPYVGNNRCGEFTAGSLGALTNGVTQVLITGTASSFPLTATASVTIAT